MSWRPQIVDDLILSKLDDWFLSWMTDAEACLYANISPATLYRYIEANPSYWERKEELKKNIKVITKRNIKKFLDEWDKDITKFVAERKIKDEFSLRTEVEEKSTVLNITAEELKSMSDEELIELQSKMK